jgi:hypothetical protein
LLSGVLVRELGEREEIVAVVGAVGERRGAQRLQRQLG